MAAKKKVQLKKVKAKKASGTQKGTGKKGAGKKLKATVKTAKSGSASSSPKKKVGAASIVKRTSAQKAQGTDAKTQTSMVGQAAPEMVRPATGGKNISLKDYLGQVVVLYFYPKDSTPGCTLEGQDFRRLQPQFATESAVVLGVSKDSIKSHENFRAKFDFSFDLIADDDESLCRSFGVIQMKSLYGRHFEGIERSTFVIGQDGRILKEWRKVKVNGHADEVLEYVKTLAR